MLHVYPDFYDKFRCIAGDCPDSCCVGWSVVVDDEAAARYNRVTGPLGDTLRSAMMFDEDGDRVFRMDHDRCPFWNEEHLCRIELELGHEAPCETCRKFPRLTQTYFDCLTEHGLTLACPVAAELILTHEGPWDVTTHDDGLPGAYSLLESGDFSQLINARSDFLGELWLDGCTEAEALCLLLLQGQRFQAVLDEFEVPAWERGQALKLLRQERRHVPYDFVKRILAMHRELDILTPRWKALLDEAISWDGPLPALGETGMARNLAADYLYRYWLQSINDYDCMTDLLLLAINWLVVTTLARIHQARYGVITQNELLILFRLYAREVEHDDVNRQALKEIIGVSVTAQELCDALQSI